MSKLADLIWKNAELLRGAFKENEYRKVILPFTILRRLDCVLQPTAEVVRAKYAVIKDKGYDLNKMLTPVSGYAFFNISGFTLPGVAQTPDGHDVRANLEAMINGFSQNVRDIFEKFGFLATVDKLAEKNRLYGVVKNFAETDLRDKDEKTRIEFERKYIGKKLGADVLEAAAEVTALFWTAIQIAQHLQQGCSEQSEHQDLDPECDGCADPTVRYRQSAPHDDAAHR